jgi:RNA-binding protein
MKVLSIKQRKHLKGLAHHLDPFLQVGKSGLSEPVLKELSRALSDHELVKTQIFEDDRETFLQLSKELAEKTTSQLVFTIGRKAIYFKQSPIQDKRRISRALPR